MRGACVSWCALFTQRQPPSMRQKRANVSRSLSFYPRSLFLSFSRFHSCIPCPFLALALRILVWTSLRCIVKPFERSQPIGAPHDDFIMKKQNARVDRTPSQSAKGETRATGRATRPLACLECLPSLVKCSSELKKEKKIQKKDWIKTPRRDRRKSERVIPLATSAVSCRP